MAPRDPDPREEAAAARWRVVRELLERALEVPEEGRAAFLEAEAGSDEALRVEVAALLEAEERGAGFDPPPLRDLAREARPEGARVGLYRLIRRVGEGGMGVVYLGVRADGQFKKRVAVKVLKRGMDTEEVLRRFERERQVLATLDHPGIARLLDGGTTEDGRPYLVMEFAQGVPIDAWCDEQRLTVAERLELFREVCDAVDHAHRSLVVHRDLKPSNVLVTVEGRVKLLDFGIAKVLDPERGFATVDLTGTPMRLLTPAYASPEQVRGSPITTASDVYSLGALLYHLLAGRPPQRPEGASPLEIERAVCERDPAPASVAAGEGEDAREVAARRGTTPRGLARALSGDLDRILAKALRKEPARRYASARELAEDLERHRGGLPIHARPDTLRYRAGKFVRRHRASVAAAGLVLASLVVALGVSLRETHAAERARGELAVQLERDRERSAELARLAARLEEERATAEEAREHADDARRVAEERAERLRALNEELEASRAATEEALAELRNTAVALVYDVHREIAPLEGALEAKQIVVDLGLGLLDRLAEGDLADAGLGRQLVGAYLRLAEVQASAQEESRGDWGAALDTLGRAAALAQELLAREDSPENRFSLSSVLFRRATALRQLGRYDDARVALERVARLCEESDVGGPDWRANGRTFLRGCSLSELALDDLSRGALDEARAHLDASEELLELTAQQLPPIRANLAGVYRARSFLAAAEGEPEARIAWLERALEIEEGIAQQRPDDWTVRLSLGLTRRLHASALIDAGRRAEGIARLDALLVGSREELAGAPDSSPLARLHAMGLVHLAGLLLEDDAERAEAALLELSELCEERSEREPLVAVFPVLHGAARILRARIDLGRGRAVAAAEGARAALAELEAQAQRAPNDPLLHRYRIAAHGTLADAYCALGRGSEEASAREWLARARASLAAAEDAARGRGRRSPGSELPDPLEALERTREEVAALAARLEGR